MPRLLHVLLPLSLLMTLAVVPGARADERPAPPEEEKNGATAVEAPEALLVERARAAGTEAQPRRRPPFGGPPANTRRPRQTDPRFGISFHSGYRALAVESELFDANELDFGLDPGDFLAARVGGEIDFAVYPRLLLTLGLDSSSARQSSSYADFVWDDGSEIEHETRLSTTELTLGVRLPLADAAARIRPYLVIGASGMVYDYWEDGEFVDFDTYDIFYDRYEETSFQVGMFFGAGFEVPVFRMRRGHSAIFGEFRAARSTLEHREAFDGFGDLSVTRTGALVGIRFWF